MPRARGHVSHVDAEGDLVASLAQRIAALERVAHLGHTGVIGEARSRNMFYNGLAAVWQRGAGITGSSNFVNVDGWITANFATGMQSIQYREDFGPPGSLHSVRSYVSTGASALGASDLAALGVRIEGRDAARLMWPGSLAVPLTVSFDIMAPSAGMIPLSVRNGSATRSYVTPVTVNQAMTWERKVVTIPPPADGAWPVGPADLPLNIFLSYGAGSNRIPGAPNGWESSDYMYLAGAYDFRQSPGSGIWVANFQVEAGAIDDPVIDIEPYAAALARCQRWLYVHSNNGINFGMLGWGVAVSGNQCTAYFALPVTMRTNPGSITALDPIGNYVVADRVNAAVAVNSFGGATATPAYAELYPNTNAVIQFRSYGLFSNGTAQARIAVSAEAA